MKTTAVWTTVLFLTASALAAPADPPPIERMAPRSTVFIAGATNMDRTMANLKATPFWSLWESDQIVEMRNKIWAEMEPDLEEALGELDLEMKDLNLPTGGVGLAVFWVRDEQLGQPMPGMMMFGDWGKHADQTSRVIEAMIKKGEEEDDLQYERIEIVGRNAYRFDIPEPEPDEADEFNGGFGGPMGDPAAVLDRIRSIYHVRDDSRFFLCTDLATLTAALEVVDGEAHPSVADREDYQAIMSQVGTGDKYAALMFRDAMNLMGGPSAIGPAMMFMPMVKQFLGDIHGMGMSARVNGSTAMLEQTVSVYMPNGRSGLTALMEVQENRARVPAFVGPEHISYSSMNFEFKGLPALAQAVMQMLPMFQMQSQEGPSPIEIMQQFCGGLGPQVHSAASVSRPLAADSMRQFVAIESSQPRNFEDALTQLAPQMGMEGRDFLGHRIFTTDLGDLMGGGMPGAAPMGGSMSVGISDRYIFAGQTPAVEQALRASAGGDQDTLADVPMFQQAAAAVGDDPVVGWGYTDIITMMESQMEIQEALMSQMMEQLAVDDPEFADEMAGDLADNPMTDMLDEIDWDAIRQYIGPAAWKMQAVDDGFVMHSYTLAPAE